MKEIVKDTLGGIIAVSLILIVGSIVVFGYEYATTYLNAKQEYAIQKLEDNNRYDSLKEVEDTARGMISSYEADLTTYTQYKDSDNDEKQSWAEQAKMRANRTASNYNNYILKNSFVWKDNIPDDIKTELTVIN